MSPLARAVRVSLTNTWLNIQHTMTDDQRSVPGRWSVITTVQQATATSAQTTTTLARPQLIFFTELAGSALQQLLLERQLLAELAAQQYSIALAMTDLSDAQAEVVQQLHAHGISTVAWLLLPPDEGRWFNLQNYPQAIERYRIFRAWAQTHHLRFAAIGLDMEPPAGETARMQQWKPARVIRRFWLARENVLYPAARAAYTDLINEIHHDGYEVHTYQLPFLADDRRAGTTLIQRALDIVDLPADVEVLMCPSSLPVKLLGNDLGGALITSYGPDADSIAIGSTGSCTGMPYSAGAGLLPLPWEALNRDILLAARYTDVIYIFSLEGCVEQNLLPRLSDLDWSHDTQSPRHRRLLVGLFRTTLLVLLLFTRFKRALLAWLGWGLAALLFLQQIRQRWQAHSDRKANHTRSQQEDS